MEKSLSNYKFTLREIAPVRFLNNLIPVNEWHIEVDANLQVVTVNGDPSDDVAWNETLRTLVWSNSSAEQWNIMAGALSFNREFTACHGKVTTGEEMSYLVESVLDGELAFNAPDTDNKAPLLYDMDKFGFMEPPPVYSALEATNGQIYYEKQAVEQIYTEDARTFDSHEGTAAAAVAPGAWASAEKQKEEEPKTTKVRYLSYTTKKREQVAPGEESEEWEPFGTIGVGTEYTGMAHTFTLFNNEDITQHVMVNHKGESVQFTKGPQKTGDPCPYSFDITFTGIGRNRKFTGTLQNKKGKTFDWEGVFGNEVEVSREGDNQRVKGSDKLMLDPLLYTVSSISRDSEYDEKTKQYKPVDLAQREADRLFGRIIFGSVDKEVSDILFPGMFNLSPAEQKIQAMAPDFLPRAGMHYVMANIKDSSQVKEKTKKRINREKCHRFLPACAAIAKPPAGGDDPVALYGPPLGWKGELPDDFTKEIQRQSQLVTRQCYLLGYHTTVSSMHPYLKNAGEWYNIMQETLTSSVFLMDFENKAIGAEGYGKMIYDIHTKLDVLWQAANENEEMKKALGENPKEPEKIVSTLNAASLQVSLDSLLFDDDAKDNLRNFFKQLDEAEKNERHQVMMKNYKRQMLVDNSKIDSFQAIGEYTIQLMDELGKAGERVSAREQLDRLAAVDASQAQNPGPKSWWKDIHWHEGFLSYIRAAVTVVSLGGLVYVLSEKGAKMEFEEQLALFGQMAEGFASARAALGKLAQATAGKAMSVGSWISKCILAPLGNICKAIGAWLFDALPRIGRQLITGIGRVLNQIKDWVALGVELVVTGVGRAVNWLKNLPINYDKVFGVIAKGLSFGISAVCFWIAIRDCINAWKVGRPLDIVMSTIGAALAGLEVLCLVIHGIAYLATGAEGAVVAFCAGAGTVLAALGIGFAIALIIVAFTCQEDPLDDLVVKYCDKYKLGA